MINQLINQLIFHLISVISSDFSHLGLHRADLAQEAGWICGVIVSTRSYKVTSHGTL